MMAPDISPWLALPAIMAGVVLLFVALHAWQVWAQPHPELVRKLFHLGGGFLALPLPWLFTGFAPVLVLGVANLAFFTLLRTVPVLRSGLGQVLSGVQRNTVGEFCFVLSLLLLFHLASDAPLFYGVPLLILAVADAFAALIGREYGKLFYSVSGGSKSIEGSLAFFVAAFFCVHIPVLLFTDTPRLESLLIGVNIGLMVMMAEAAAWWGLDNLIIPLFSYVLLRTFVHMDAPELLEHLGFLVGLSLFIHFWRQRTTLADDGLFGVSLWGYLAWAIAGWQWVVPALIMITVYTSVTRHTPGKLVRKLNFPVALANLFGCVIWLLLFWQTSNPAFFTAYAAVYGADLAIISLVRQRNARPNSSLRSNLAWGCIKGGALLLPSVLLFYGIDWAAFINLAAAVLVMVVATWLFAILQPDLERYPVDSSRWLRQAAITTVTSVLGFLPIVLNLTGGG